MPPKKVIFLGGGGMYNYYLGIAYAIQRYTKIMDDDDVKYCGISAGVIPSFALTLKIDAKSLFDEFNKNLHQDLQQHYFGALFNMQYYWKLRSMQIIPDCACALAEGKLHVLITKLPTLEPVIINKWESTEDLIECMLTSAQLPGLIGHGLWRNYRDGRYIDGCFSDPFGKTFEPEEGDIVLHGATWRLTNPSWYWCWSNQNWANDMFTLGVQDAINNLDGICIDHDIVMNIDVKKDLLERIGTPAPQVEEEDKEIKDNGVGFINPSK